MSDLLPGLIVLAIGGSIAPPLLLLTNLCLGSRKPLPNATALVLGYFTTCAAIGIFADYGATYGSLGAAVGLLFYLYLTVSVVLLCAEVNATIYFREESGKQHRQGVKQERGTATER